MAEMTAEDALTRTPPPDANGAARDRRRVAFFGEGGVVAMAGQCRATTKDGRPCPVPAIHGKDVCCVHDPDMEEKRRQSRSAGGKKGSRKTLPDAADMPADFTLGDLKALIAGVVSSTRRGEIDCKVANACLYGASIALRTLQSEDTEERLLAVESAVRQLAARLPAGNYWPAGEADNEDRP
jgi:hypothetical protein